MAFRRSLMVVGLAVATIGASQVVAHDFDTAHSASIAGDPDVVIAYRKGVMSIIGANAHALSDIAKGNLDREEAFGDHAGMLAMAGKLTYEAFGQNTHGQGKKEKTTAKEKVWAEWGEFKKGLDKLNEAASKVAVFAGNGDLASAKGSLEDLFKTCKGCHDDFREK